MAIAGVELPIALGMLGLYLASRLLSPGRPRGRARRHASRATHSNDLVQRLERGEGRGSELGELLRSGALRFSRNPQAAPAPTRLSPADRQALRQAQRLAQEFHGTSTAVVELRPEERGNLPRFVTVAGELADFSYVPPPGSARAGYQWRHTSGDRGPFEQESPYRPLVVVDPRTRRPALLRGRSPMRLDPEKGFVG